MRAFTMQPAGGAGRKTWKLHFCTGFSGLDKFIRQAVRQVLPESGLPPSTANSTNMNILKTINSAAGQGGEGHSRLYLFDVGASFPYDVLVELLENRNWDGKAVFDLAQGKKSTASTGEDFHSLLSRL